MHLRETVFSSLQRQSLAVCLFLAACFSGAPLLGFVVQDDSDSARSRSLGEYRADLKTFMKLSKDDDPQLERNAIYNLCQLHFEIVTDSRFETNQQLQGMRAVIAKRLDTFTKDERKSKLRAEREAKKTGSSSGGSDQSGSTDLSQSGTSDPAASSSNSGDPVTANASGNADNSSTDSAGNSGIDGAMYDSASESYDSMGSMTGGPNQIFSYAGGRFAPPWDYGEDLVNLITTVIDPNFWRRNGGPGSIHYYQPSLVLVVRASQQGSEEVGSLLEKLRANAATQLNIGGFRGAIGN
jgi:hypothetical protein